MLVILAERTRGHSPLGRVTNVQPGKDGHVRVVKVLVGNHEMHHPIMKVCPLEFGCNGDEQW